MNEQILKKRKGGPRPRKLEAPQYNEIRALLREDWSLSAIRGKLSISDKCWMRMRKEDPNLIQIINRNWKGPKITRSFISTACTEGE